VNLDRLLPLDLDQKEREMHEHDNESGHRSDAALTNVVILRGAVRGEPVIRELPGRGVMVQFDVSTRLASHERASTVSAPVAWADPSATSLAAVVDGAEVVVVGTVRRRFFRVGGATQSRTEVVADSVIPSRRRKQVDAALDAVLARL
jgi:single-strand DNA-binding protein